MPLIGMASEHGNEVVLRELARDEVDGLDAVRALVDRRDAGVAQMLDRPRLLDEAHAAMDLDAGGGDVDADIGRVGFGDWRQNRGTLGRGLAPAN